MHAPQLECILMKNKSMRSLASIRNKRGKCFYGSENSNDCIRMWKVLRKTRTHNKILQMCIHITHICEVRTHHNKLLFVIPKIVRYCPEYGKNKSNHKNLALFFVRNFTGHELVHHTSGLCEIYSWCDCIFSIDKRNAWMQRQKKETEMKICTFQMFRFHSLASLSPLSLFLFLAVLCVSLLL